MRVAFYAPLKPIDHPVPSGDRLMARAFIELLRGLGHDVAVASRFRSYERQGSLAAQQALRTAAAMEAQRLLAAYAATTAPELWFTYHAYHKAPDWLGPAVTRALRIPYVVAEASIAGKQAGGPWDLGHRATIDAVNAASLVLAMTTVDEANLAKHLKDPNKLRRFPPFLPFDDSPPADRSLVRRRLASDLAMRADVPWLITVAMMRADIKLQSYRLLAAALGKLQTRQWQVLVVGDGDAGPAVREALQAAVGNHVRCLGQLPRQAISELYQAADIFAWPGLREAYGMAILEALAAGLPVVACREGGVSDLVEDGWNGFLAVGRSADDLAGRIGRLLDDQAGRAVMGEHARSRFAERHSRAAAEARLVTTLAELANAVPRR